MVGDGGERFAVVDVAVPRAEVVYDSEELDLPRRVACLAVVHLA